MVLEFILLLKNNNFKYIQSWKQTNLLHLCVKQIWWLMTYVCNSRKWNSSGTQHGVTLHCKADPALLWTPSLLQRRGWGGKGTKQTQPEQSADQGSHLQFAILKQIPDEFRGFFFLFCWQSSVGSWARATQLSSTPEIWALNWAWLPHTYKYSCLQGNLNPLKACKCWSCLMK